MTVSLLMHAIYFPEEGGMLLPPGLSFDPQLIKPAAGQKGADELNFNGDKTKTKGESNQTV